MKVGFDVDWTLDQPAIRDLANTLYEAGSSVFAVSFGDRQRITNDLKKWGVKYTRIFCNEDGRSLSNDLICQWKGKVCKDNGIELYFDDRDDFLNGVKKVSPETKLCKPMWPDIPNKVKGGMVESELARV